MGIEIELLADKYLNNKCSSEEAQLVLLWFNTASGRKYLQMQLERDTLLLQNDNLFISPANLPSSKMFDAILQVTENMNGADGITGTIHAGEVEASSITAPLPESRRWYPRLGVAAAVFLVFFITLYYLYERPVTRATRYGETARIVLPDSSVVTLNGNSSIEYSPAWKRNDTRRVKLNGEAYFSVKHQSNKQKFVVALPGDIQVEVLGTEFNISDRKHETQVVLVSGLIRLNIQGKNQHSSLTMKPGESIEIFPERSLMYRNYVDPAVITSWKDNKLIFENTSVREICERLKDTYGYRISVSDDEVLNQHITGSVPNQNIDMVLEGLEVILGVKFSKWPE
jgi:ferric-dicitrate binding protein FerR (iron transport regulator)